ncbi:2-methylcitrate dehydratase PrpD [Rhodoblastus acidophilus]|uniref:hypothetical protein n=1 Tax=Rhodoblastus acidophilus TaxID=1074 RepID=UPI0022240B07|nr:hypothetical protein [Rhodoblastus acidophilus]MCW2319119.1 2-methylcitrate dehydratase PrpD [Rhodoblastus acidophilus]
MIDSTYNADIAGAIALNPSIASNITQGLDGKMDPATEAYAAAYELRQDALILQKNGISDPTVLDTRTLYQFGQGAGVAVAKAPDSANLSSYLNLPPLNWRQTASRRARPLANGGKRFRRNLDRQPAKWC